MIIILKRNATNADCFHFRLLEICCNSLKQVDLLSPFAIVGRIYVDSKYGHFYASPHNHFPPISGRNREQRMENAASFPDRFPLNSGDFVKACLHLFVLWRFPFSSTGLVGMKLPLNSTVRERIQKQKQQN